MKISDNSLVLTSPNGLYTITLEATDHGAGIWVQEKGGPMAQFLAGFNEGAVVAVTLDPDHMFANDIALVASKDEAPHIQFADNVNHDVYMLDLSKVNDL